MDSLENYRILLAIADHGGFSAAARALRLTTAKVSRSIATLELELRTPLLKRTTRRVELTAKGAAFVARLRPAMAGFEMAAASLQDAAITWHFKSLRISAGRAEGAALVAPALASFAAVHPACLLALDLHDRPVHLDNEGYDLALSCAPADKTAETASLFLLDTPQFIVAAPTYIALHNRPRAATELLQHRLLLWREQPVWNLRGGDSITSPAAFFSNDLSVIRICCIAANGIALLPAPFIEQDLHEKTLLPLLDGFEPKPLQLVARWSGGGEPCPAVTAFLSHFKRHLRGSRF